MQAPETTSNNSLTGRSTGADDRLKQTSAFARLVRRPEMVAVAGFLFVTLFFVFAANPAMFSLAGVLNILTPASHLGIIAVAAALLMIGGEFDLSVGSMIAFSGFVFGAALVVLNLPLPLALLVTFAVAAVVGLLNAFITLRTGLPSFIVTLAFMFILRGLSLIGLKLATGGATQLRGLREHVTDNDLTPLFSGLAFPGVFQWLADVQLMPKLASGLPAVPGVPVSILWFVGITIAATLILNRTRYGNWIFAAGGDPSAARNSGVPVGAVKTALFVSTACCAALVGIVTSLDAGSTDALRGSQKEFEAVIAAVIGGCLLTGGYGSAIGAFFGAIIFGMVIIGLSYTRIDQDWYLVFLGAMLLVAVVFNSLVRRRVTGER